MNFSRNNAQVVNQDSGNPDSLVNQDEVEQEVLEVQAADLDSLVNPGNLVVVVLAALVEPVKCECHPFRY